MKYKPRYGAATALSATECVQKEYYNYSYEGGALECLQTKLDNLLGVVAAIVNHLPSEQQESTLRALGYDKEISA